MKKLVMILSILVILCGITGCGEKKPKFTYEDGIIESGKTIEDYYNLSGSKQTIAMDGGNGTVAVTVCEVSIGGYVAWEDRYYSYCKDGGEMTVATHLAMDVLGLEAYDPKDFN